LGDVSHFVFIYRWNEQLTEMKKSRRKRQKKEDQSCADSNIQPASCSTSDAVCAGSGIMCLYPQDGRWYSGRVIQKSKGIGAI